MKPARTLALFALVSLISVGGYLAASWAGGFLGFPLDDAWIHQTYARHLGTAGQFAFVPGQPSAGSTAPLWSGLLALGHALRLEPRAWAYALGWASLLLNAWLAYRLVLRHWPERGRAAVMAGLFVALEWHVVWASVSGMETALFMALALAAFALPDDRPAWLGGLVGVSVLVRPDGLTLLPFALARLWLNRPRDWQALARCALGFGAVFGPYLAFNCWLSGALWPNTFYAKQAEYALLQKLPLWERLLARCGPGGCEPGVGPQPFIGAQMLLIPGLAAFAWTRWRARSWEALLPLSWVIGFIGLYALRLPVTYQHGRYVMAVIPALAALGLGGLSEVLRWHSPRFWLRVVSRAAAMSVAALALGFWLIGATAYQRDVQIIETEMVAAARWINANTPAEAVIAAHDIGALGYFGGREILDLAGLISPEVIPFIRDEARIRDWLLQSRATYFMTLEGWYPDLERGLRVIYRSTAPYSPRQGGANMVVYGWPPP
jgi:hypothetical protein